MTQSGKNVNIFRFVCKVAEHSVSPWMQSQREVGHSSSIFIGPANQNVTTIKYKIQNYNWILSFQTRKEYLDLIEA